MALPLGCGSCGAADAGRGESCALCGALLLVDVVLQTAVPSPRQIFEIARDLATNVPGLPPFGELREGLAGPGRRIRAVPRASGIAAVKLLGGHHLAATAQPNVVRARPGRKDGWRLAAAGAAGLAALALGYMAFKVDVPREKATEEVTRPVIPGLVPGKPGFRRDDPAAPWASSPASVGRHPSNLSSSVPPPESSPRPRPSPSFGSSSDSISSLQEAGRERMLEQRIEQARARVEGVDRDVERAKAEMNQIGPNAGIVSDANPTLGTKVERLQSLQSTIDGAGARRRAAEDAIKELERQTR